MDIPGLRVRSWDFTTMISVGYSTMTRPRIFADYL